MKQAHNEFDGYFLWLCDLVNADLDKYSDLLFYLHDMDFVWCIELDESRANEGLDLRKEYCEVNKYFDTDWVMLMEKPCSVFEALIGIARRMDDMLIEDNTSERVAVWFWEMVKNLGLKRFTDFVFMNGKDEDFYEFEMILNIWMNREFNENGEGSPFPLHHPTHNQQNRTIIYQLNDYILENYMEDYDEFL